MTDIVRYVDTAASASGNGVDQTHDTGDYAYDTLANWESSEQTDLTSGPDTHTVHCAGSTNDTTNTSIAGWGTSATATITVKGDRAAPDSDGFYGGADLISEAHYIKEATSGNALTISQQHLTVDGLQIHMNHNANTVIAILLQDRYNYIYRNRLRSAQTSATDHMGIGRVSTTGWFNTINIDSNLIVGFTHGINLENDAFGTGTLNIYNNTIYGCDVAGIFGSDGAAGGDFVIKNNAVHSTTTAGGDANVTIGGGGSSTYDTNAFEDSEGTTNEVSISGAASTYFTSPGLTIGGDFHIVDSSALHNAGISIGEDLDADDQSRSADTSGYDIGAFLNSTEGGGFNPAWAKQANIGNGFNAS
jgi:hypothetical protein